METEITYLGNCSEITISITHILARNSLLQKLPRARVGNDQT